MYKIKKGELQGACKIQNRRHFPPKTTICRCSRILQRLTVSRIIDQFGGKICQKKRKDVD